MRVRGHRGGYDFLFAGALTAQLDIVADRAVEQERILPDKGDALAQRREGNVAQVRAVDGHGTGRRIVKAHHQIDDRRLAATRGADQRGRLAGGEGQVEAFEDRMAFVISEADVVEAHLTLAGGSAIASGFS